MREIYGENFCDTEAITPDSPFFSSHNVVDWGTGALTTRRRIDQQPNQVCICSLDLLV